MKNSSEIAEEILYALKIAIGDKSAPLHEPCFLGNEWRYVKDCLDTSYVSSIGKYVEEFEKRLSEYTGSPHVIAVVNGTAALHISLLLAGVEPGDEVLVPALTFIATANAVSYCGAIPHFVDSDYGTLGIDASRLRDYLKESMEIRGGFCLNKKTKRIVRAVVPMHTFGHPVDINGLLAVAKDFNLRLIEDAAEALGSTYYGQHVGTFGQSGILSFNGNKIITTGGGGAILTGNSELAKKAKHITTTAKLPHAWEYRHDEIGYNYRMPNLNAALGCAQLEQLDAFILSKRSLHSIYSSAFFGIDAIELVTELPSSRSNYWLQAILLKPEWIKLRELILSKTNAAGIMTRPAWVLLNKLTQYSTCPSMDLEVSINLADRLINIPSSANLTDL